MTSIARKIVQIAIDPSTSDSAANIYALCSDGSLWWKSTACDSSWFEESSQVPSRPIEPGDLRSYAKSEDGPEV